MISSEEDYEVIEIKGTEEGVNAAIVSCFC